MAKEQTSQWAKITEKILTVLSKPTMDSLNAEREAKMAALGTWQKTIEKRQAQLDAEGVKLNEKESHLAEKEEELAIKDSIQTQKEKEIASAGGGISVLGRLGLLEGYKALPDDRKEEIIKTALDLSMQDGIKKVLEGVSIAQKQEVLNIVEAAKAQGDGGAMVDKAIAIQRQAIMADKAKIAGATLAYSYAMGDGFLLDEEGKFVASSILSPQMKEACAGSKDVAHSFVEGYDAIARVSGGVLHPLLITKREDEMGIIPVLTSTPKIEEDSQTGVICASYERPSTSWGANADESIIAGRIIEGEVPRCGFQDYYAGWATRITGWEKANIGVQTPEQIEEHREVYSAIVQKFEEQPQADQSDEIEQ